MEHNDHVKKELHTTHRHHKISIFNKITVNPVIEQKAKPASNGIADCFKALFSCIKR